VQINDELVLLHVQYTLIDTVIGEQA